MDDEAKIKEWLKYFSITEILEQSDLTEEEALIALFKSGYIEPPPWIDNNLDDDNEYD